MGVLPRSVEKVIEELERLPGVGPKSAARMTYFLLRAPRDWSASLAEALVKMRELTVTCTECFNVADHDPCKICSDSGRDRTRLCVVEEPLDVVALELSGVFDGRYFILGGVVSPAEGIGPEQLRFDELKERVKSLLDKHVDKEELEVIIATNPSLEGEATASYIVEVLKGIDEKTAGTLKISRLAMGLPTGADLEYADRLTLKRSLEGRTRVYARGD
jgi:recombination protein RecR